VGLIFGCQLALDIERRFGFVLFLSSLLHHLLPLLHHTNRPPSKQDHAPGSLLVTESGGIISDSRGEPLDFGKGTTLGENFGVVAAGREVHAQIIKGISEVKKAEAEGEGRVSEKTKARS
jgi:hypothetical protein